PPPAETELRLEHEKATFDADRYLGDLFTEEEDPLLTEALTFEPHWKTSRWPAPHAVELASVTAEGDDSHTESGKGEAGRDTGAAAPAGTRATTSPGKNSKEGIHSAGEEKGGGRGEEGGLGEGEGEGEGKRDEDGVFEGFSEVEEEQMRRLPNREYLIPAGGFEEKRALLGLADILFSYAYDHRTTGGDATVESAWTVAVLSPLLTWLEVRGLVASATVRATGDVDETCVALAGLRRSLIFPYLRVWELGTLVVKDVRDILSAGKRCILRCLLQVRCDVVPS
ncbi:unnamed protein product, partial [Laminaria digitata]